MKDEMRPTVAPVEVWQQWYNAASEAWAKAVKDISDDEDSSAASPFLKSYLSYIETFRRVAQEYWETFQPATRPDIAHLAELVEAIEDKVDHVDKAVNEVSSGYAKLTADDALGKVERRLAQVQSSVSEQEPAVERRVAHLVQQLGQVEQKLGWVETATGQLQKTLGEHAPAVERRLHHLEQKLGGMETAVSHLQSTLDQLIVSLEQSGAAGKSVDKEATAEERKAGTKRAPTSGQPADQV